MEMLANSTVDKITDEELQSLCLAIFTRHGIDFSNYEPNSFKRRVARVIDKYQLESMIGLWRKLMYEKEFLYTFIDEITVGLTEMFRNPEFWSTIPSKVFDHLKHKDAIHIWHAGCSTGEEVYSMLILLEHLNLDKKTKLYATDLNSNSVKQTEKGEYDLVNEKKYNSNLVTTGIGTALSIYYTLGKDTFVFDKLNRSVIKAYQHNLVKDTMIQKFDFVLCRNVMIYFDDKLKMKILKLFYDSMYPNSYFAIGYYDAMPEGYQELFTLYDPNIKLYKRKD